MRMSTRHEGPSTLNHDVLPIEGPASRAPRPPVRHRARYQLVLLRTVQRGLTHPHGRARDRRAHQRPTQRSHHTHVHTTHTFTTHKPCTAISPCDSHARAASRVSIPCALRAHCLAGECDTSHGGARVRSLRFSLPRHARFVSSVQRGSGRHDLPLSLSRFHRPESHAPPGIHAGGGE